MTCCNNYVAQFDPHEIEVVCASCGVVNNEETEIARSLTNEEQQRTAIASHSMPVNALLINELGSQHDMVSLSNRGLAMDLGRGSSARDYQRRRCKPLLADAYITGQVVGKGSKVIIEKDGTLKVKSDYHYDKMYRNAKIQAYQRATKLQLGPVEQRLLGKELDKTFCQWGIDLSPKLMAIMALMRMTKYKGLSLKLSNEVIEEYLYVIEKVRAMVTEFHEQYVVPLKQQ